MTQSITSRVWLNGETTEQASEVMGAGRCVVTLRRRPEAGEGQRCEDAAATVDWGGSGSVLIVADGLGGHGDGDVAARIAVQSIVARLESMAFDLDAIQVGILSGIQSANQELIDRPGGAATTILVALIAGDRIRSYHAGDSELLITGQRGKIKHQTVSHSPVGYAVESGLLDADQGFAHADRHFVSNYVGMPGMRVEMASAIRLAARDTVVLASDGLWDNAHVEEVTQIVRKGPLDGAGRILLDLCAKRMEAGGGGKPDDLAIVLYRPTAGK